MCGIAGIISSGPLTDIEICTVKRLGLLTTTRGLHSSGVVLGSEVEKNEKNPSGMHINYWKRTCVLPALLYNDVKLNERLHSEGSKPRFLLAHARHATVGLVNQQNAHPHVCGRIVGIHNGTINAFERKDDPNYSDSRHLFQRINDVGLDEAVREAGDGAMAIMYADINAGRTVVYRNTKRTLYVGENYNASTFFFASEEWMLKDTASAQGTSSISCIKIVPCDTVFSFDWKTGARFSRTIGKEDEKEIRPFVYQPGKGGSTQTTQTAHLTHHHVQRSICDPSQRLSRKQLKRLQKKGEINGLPLLTSNQTSSATNPPPFDPSLLKPGSHGLSGTFRGFRQFFPLDQADRLLRKGCAYCGQDSDHKDVVYWTDYTEHLCSECGVDKDIVDGIGGPQRLVRGEMTDHG